MTRNLVVHAVCAVVVASGAASAAEQQSLDEGWPARWNKVGPVETGVVAGLGTSIIFLEFLLKSPSTPRWDKPILFDADARSALRAGSPGGRSRAATASDFGYAGLPIYATVVEAGPAALTVAATTGLLRIVSDRHWASDVLLGAVLGTAVGGTVSWAHMHDGDGAPSTSLSLGPDGRSFVYGGRF